MAEPIRKTALMAAETLESLSEGKAMTAPGHEVITKDPDILGGTPVFRGTRVLFQALLDYLEGGQTLDEFLEDFPPSAVKLPLAPSSTPTRWPSASCNEAAARRMSS
jgi:uncharacterized protein (DUF433 family)